MTFNSESPCDLGLLRPLSLIAVILSNECAYLPACEGVGKAWEQVNEGHPCRDLFLSDSTNSSHQ